MHRLGERKQLLLPHVVAEYPGEAAIGPRVSGRAQERALGRHRGAVGADRHPRAAERLAEIVLRHGEERRSHPRPVRRDQIQRGVDGVDAALGGDLGQHAPLPLLVVFGVDLKDQHAPGLGHVPPAPGARQDGTDLGADRRVGQPVVEGIGAALVIAVGDDAGQTGRAGRIRVDVGGDRLAVRPSLLKQADRPVHLVPVRPAGRLQVEYLADQARITANLQELGERAQQVIALAADVRGVTATESGRHPAQLGQLGSARIAARRVDQRRGDPQRAVGHLLSHQRPHPVHLGGRRRAVVITHDVHPDRAAADERGHVLGGAAALHVGQVLRQPGPADVVVQAMPVELKLGLHLRDQRAHRDALTEHLRGHALGQLA